MTAPHRRLVDSHKRCTNITRRRDGTEVECSDVGTWVLDKDAKTWRPAKPTDKARRCWAHGPGAEAKPHGKGGRRKTQPNARINRAAGVLEQLAPEATKALEEIADELSLLGFPSASNRGSSYVEDTPDPVGDDAARIAQVTGYREDLRDWIDDMCDRVNAGVLLIARIRNVRHAHGVKLCSENQQGRKGSIEWGDAACTELPTQDGLCARCYQAERRWRRDNDQPALGIPAA